MNYFIPPEHPISSNSPLESGDYELIVRQQPKEALITQAGKEKNRKPIDPPPIVQLKVPEMKDPVRQFLQSPYLFMICHLESGDSSMPEREAKDALTGSISSSLHRLKDINNEDGGFFVFGDISVKTAGTHRLRFTLMELQKDEGRVINLRSVVSEPFQVVPQKHWRGLEESTYLSRAFSDQGVRLRLRKENRAMSSQKRNYNTYQDAQPGSSSVAGEQQTGSAYGASPVSSHYGYGDGAPKRHRSDDYGQPNNMFAERAIQTYAPRDFMPSSVMTGYPVQHAAPRQSPQTPFGFSQSMTSSNMQQFYGQGQPAPSMRGMEPNNSRQAQATTPGGSFTFQSGSMGGDPSDYFPRRPTESYGSIQHTPSGMASTVAGTPTENYQNASQTIYPTAAGQHTGGSATSLYPHSNVPSPMGAATGGSSTSAHTPPSARGSALNPSAQSFTLGSHPSQAHQLQSQQFSTYNNVPDPHSYSFGGQYVQQQPQQSFQNSPPTTMQHLTQPLTAPHRQQRPPDPSDPYGQHWPANYGP